MVNYLYDVCEVNFDYLAVGALHLCDVRPAHVRTILDAVMDAGKKRQTVMHVRGAMRQMVEVPVWTGFRAGLGKSEQTGGRKECSDKFLLHHHS